MVKGLAWGEDFAGRIQRENFRVHSVFRSVCNLQADRARPLLALVLERGALGPNALWLEQACLADRLQAGQEVHFAAGRIVCGALEIDCSEVIPYQRVVGPAAPWDGTALGQVQNWLELQAPGFASGQSKLAAMLGRGLLEENEALLRAALRGLLGSGQGLTPWGDDFAAGVLHAYVRAGPAGNPFLNQLPGIVGEAALQTNEISRTMLWYAARGTGPAYMADVVDGIAAGGPGALLPANRLRHVGSSSGLYLLAGILLGCKITEAREQVCDGRENLGQTQYLF